MGTDRKLCDAVGFGLLLLSSSRLAAQEIPDQVRYIKTSEEINQKAGATLRELFTSRPYRPAALGVETAKGPVFVGPFLFGRMVQDRVVEAGTLAKVVYALPLDQAKGVKVEMHGVAADTRARRAAFDEAFDSWADFDPPVRIRRLTPEELALIWFYIGWDISEPILVVEAGSHTLVVDFTDDGESLHWLEDISQPCFQAVVGGGTRRGSCFCSVVISEKGRYAVTFQRRSEQDPPCPVAQPPTEPPGAGPEASTQGFEMISIVLYQPDQILRARVPSVEALTAYLKELQGVCGRFFAGSTRLETLDVVVAVRPGRSKVWFVSSGGPEQEARLNSLREQLEAVPVLDVRRGPVAFAIVGAVAGARRTLPSTAAVYQAPMPKEWKDAAAQIGTTVQVPDGILEVVWPEKK